MDFGEKVLSYRVPCCHAIMVRRLTRKWDAAQRGGLHFHFRVCRLRHGRDPAKPANICTHAPPSLAARARDQPSNSVQTGGPEHALRRVPICCMQRQRLRALQGFNVRRC